MEKITYIISETFVYRHSIILALAILTAAFLFLALWAGAGKSWIKGFLICGLCALLCPVLARLCHWYFQSAEYPSFSAAMTDYSQGNYALMGVFAGCFITAGLLKLTRMETDSAMMLDCMSLAGCAGMAVGRLSFLYTDADRGMLLESITSLPFASPVTDAVTGEVSYRLATFMLQAMFCTALLVGLGIHYFLGHIRKQYRPGQTALLFLAFHGAGQAIFDSTRYDSLFMRSNGFVGVVQILGAVLLVTVIVIYSVQMVRSRRWHWWYLGLWCAVLAGLGLAGFMEYYVQRHGNQAAMCYSLMTLGLAVCLAVLLVIRRFSLKKSLQSP